MSTLTLVIIVIVVFAMIIGNLLMLKSSASHKLPSLKDYKNPEDKIEDDLSPSEKNKEKGKDKAAHL